MATVLQGNREVGPFQVVEIVPVGPQEVEQTARHIDVRQADLLVGKTAEAIELVAVARLELVEGERRHAAVRDPALVELHGVPVPEGQMAERLHQGHALGAVERIPLDGIELPDDVLQVPVLVGVCGDQGLGTFHQLLISGRVVKIRPCSSCDQRKFFSWNRLSESKGPAPGDVPPLPGGRSLARSCCRASGPLQGPQCAAGAAREEGARLPAPPLRLNQPVPGQLEPFGVPG